MSFFSSLVSLLPTAYAEEAVATSSEVEVATSTGIDASEKEEVEEPAAEEEEDEPEPEDTAPGIRDACASTKKCAAFKHHLDECAERVASGKTLIKGEDCVEELFHFMHCVDACSSDKLFASLK